MKPSFTIWITKYALTCGIYPQSAVIKQVDGQEVAIVDFNKKDPTYYYAGQWARTKYDALQVAQQIKDHQISQLKRRIARLKRLEIDVWEPSSKKIKLAANRKFSRAQLIRAIRAKKRRNDAA